jgi:hypothetical protein
MVFTVLGTRRIAYALAMSSSGRTVLFWCDMAAYGALPGTDYPALQLFNSYRLIDYSGGGLSFRARPDDRIFILMQFFEGSPRSSRRRPS